MTELHHLPTPPASVKALRDDEFLKLNAMIPGLPQSLKDCPTCQGDRNFLWYADYPTDKTVVTYECPCADQIRLFYFFLNAGMGKSYQVLTRHDIDDEVYRSNIEAMDAIADYWQNSKAYVARGFGLMLHGPNGTGKTLLSSLLMKKLLVNGLNGYFTQFTTLLNNFSAGWTSKEEAAWFERKVTHAEVLIIDDIGKEAEYRVKVSSNTLDNLLRTRVQHDLPTIITTNLSMGEFRKTYSTSTWGLLTEKVFTYEIKGQYDDDRVGFRERKNKLNMEELRNRLVRPIVWE